MEENNNEEKGCLGQLGGCLGKIIGFIILLLVLTFVKICSKSMMRNSMKYGQTETILDNKADIDSQLYSTMVEMRASLPQPLDEKTIMKDVEMDEDYFYYVTDVDDSDYDLSSAEPKAMKTAHREYLKTIVPKMKLLIECLIKTDRGLVYRFCGTSSGISTEITYSTSELQQLLN